MKIDLRISTDVPLGKIYLLPDFIKCRHCSHEIPIGRIYMTGMIDCTGGCGKRSLAVDYAKLLGAIEF